LVLLGLYGVSAADAVAASLLTLVVYAFWAALGGLLWWLEQRREIQEREPTPLSSISVVIPTLNEAQTLAETLSYARKVAGVCEMIVVDGGSQDGTPELARTLGCRVLSSGRGRGKQMRVGAMKAVGDVVLLLHADTWLPPEAANAILDCLRDRTVIGGGFWKVFRNPSWLMRGSRFRCALRLYLAGRIAGDQAIFVRRSTLENIGGVPDMPLMEEFELCRRLRSKGRLALAGATVKTSTRRFMQLGTIRTYLRMWRVSMQYRLGTPPQELLRLYEKD
jgi:rSAM/selenodomain-associated transferase 2